jgi:hypothetical protein
MHIRKKISKKKKTPWWKDVAENWRLYLILTVIVVSLAGSSYLYHFALANQKSVELWPTTQAEIKESEVTRRPASPPNLHTMSASLTLLYQVDGKPITARYFRTWSTSDDRDFENILSEGKTLDIKYSPRDTTTVSLAPLAP